MLFDFQNFFLFQLLILFSAVSARDKISPSTERERRHILPLLGYIHGYKIGQNFALQLPPFVLSPIVIVPSVNQQQSVNVQKASGEESYQENGGTLQKIAPAKLIKNITEDENNETNDDNDDDLPLSLKVDDNSEIHSKNNYLSSSENDTFKQIDLNEMNSNSQESSETDDNLNSTPYSTTDTAVENIETANTTTKAFGPYPTAIYNNNNLSTLSITISPFQNNLTVPNMEDKLQNFSLPTLGESKNITKENNSNDSNSTENNIYFPTTLPSTDKYSFYPPPRYYQNLDRLSITTNFHTNEPYLPPAYDDRWQRFSPARKSYVNSGFRPLAGLYYDGFLHKSLDKQMGFLPNRNNNYYY